LHKDIDYVCSAEGYVRQHGQQKQRQQKINREPGSGELEVKRKMKSDNAR